MVEILKTLLSGRSLSQESSCELMEKILGGAATPEQTGAVLVALAMKGESSIELLGFLESLRARMIEVKIPFSKAIDVCGTGGDGSGAFNISTCVAFIAASAGVPVAKHGNRAISSRSGSADVLAALGVEQSKDPSHALDSMEKYGLAFMFAPSFHPLLNQVAVLRRNLGVRTAFNLLGPMLNPARVERQLIGVFSGKYVPIVAETLLRLGTKEAMVVCGEGGFDEFSLLGPTRVAHLKDHEIRYFNFDPRELGFKIAKSSDLAGGDAIKNARILKAILNGAKGPARDVVVLNSAAALTIAGVAKDLVEGVGLAETAIDSGRSIQLLQKMSAHVSESVLA